MSSEKIVEHIEWYSLEGQTLYREMYTDGTKGARVSVPEMSNLPPEKLQRMQEQIENARIGQAVRFANPLPQRRW